MSFGSCMTHCRGRLLSVSCLPNGPHLVYPQRPNSLCTLLMLSCFHQELRISGALSATQNSRSHHFSTSSLVGRSMAR